MLEKDFKPLGLAESHDLGLRSLSGPVYASASEAFRTSAPGCWIRDSVGFFHTGHTTCRPDAERLFRYRKRTRSIRCPGARCSAGVRSMAWYTLWGRRW